MTNTELVQLARDIAEDTGLSNTTMHLIFDRIKARGCQITKIRTHADIEFTPRHTFSVLEGDK